MHDSSLSDSLVILGSDEVSGELDPALSLSDSLVIMGSDDGAGSIGATQECLSSFLCDFGTITVTEAVVRLDRLLCCYDVPLHLEHAQAELDHCVILGCDCFEKGENKVVLDVA